MSDFKIEEISAFLKKRMSEINLTPQIYSVGTVTYVSDGVVHIEGLSHCLYNELLEFEGGVYGMAIELGLESVGAVLLDRADRVNIGSTVKGTGRVAEIPVGPQLLGRVVDPVGRPLDGKELEAKDYLPVERPAPTIMDRTPVKTPLYTGITAIDSMVPIGRGQRELIIGDRQTGKTSIALDAVLNQKNTGVVCIYCAIGQKASSVAQVIHTLEKNDALKYSVVVAATASDSPAMQYLAPYAACAVAEGFARSGGHALVIYDDLSKHAVAYRAMSLLLHRPPGREAYPGDVFYLHSRLLERAAALSEQKGGGTITALPIVETTGGNISAYIPTNVISITDGQIYLESDLFHSGVRPAVNTGLSVSRVGRSAQEEAMKKVAGTLRITLSQYREMMVFARFGSDVDAATQKALDNGRILTELFKQQNSNPYKLSQMVTLLAAFYSDAFSGIAPNRVKDAQSQFMHYIESAAPDMLANIDSTGKMSDETYGALRDIIGKWEYSNNEGR